MKRKEGKYLNPKLKQPVECAGARGGDAGISCNQRKTWRMLLLCARELITAPITQMADHTVRVNLSLKALS